MTAHFLPPIAAQQKPAAAKAEFPDVALDALAQVPGRKGLPWLGILPEAVLDPLRFARRMYERYGPVHRFHACGSWNVQLVGPEANEFVLLDEAGNFSAQGGWRPVFGKHFDGGLLLRDGADHRWHRKLIAAAFKQDQLEAYIRMFVPNLEAAAADWSGSFRNLHETAQRLTFANGYQAFLGRSPAEAISVVGFPFPGNSEWRARWAKRHVEKLIRGLMREDIAAERSDLLAVLVRMRDANLLSDDEIISHLNFVVAASFDTLSSGTTSILYYLARNPQWQRAAREELLANMPTLDSIGMAPLQRSEISEWCFKEALRLNAAAPVLWRRSVRPFRFGGHDFPAGTITGVNPMLTHLMPEVWRDPAAFDPSRFAPEETRRRHRFAFVPFGGGAHSCLGLNYASLQVRAMLRVILERHELVLESEGEPHWYHWPNCRPRRAVRLMLKPIGS